MLRWILRRLFRMNENVPGNMRFCRDCKYAKVNFIDRLNSHWAKATCMKTAPIEDMYNLVDGKKDTPWLQSCRDMRRDDEFHPIGECGSDGKLWEAK